MAVTQSHFRFGIDQGTESTHGWFAPEDVSPASGTIRHGLTFLLRFCLQCDGTAQSNVDAEFQYRLNGGTWTQITTSSSVVKAVTPTCWADAANTTKRLSGTGTFESSSAGCTVDGIAGGTAFDIVSNGNGETECALQLVPGDSVVGDLIEFRLTRDGGTLIDTYAVTPSITLAEPIARAKVVRGPFPFPKEKPDFLPSAVGPTTAGLTGESATSAIGSAALSIAATLAAVVATGAISLGGSAVTVGLTGVSASSAVGSVVAEEAPTLTGAPATGSPGTCGPTITVTLSGVSATGAVGTLTPESGVVVALTGVAGTGALGSLGVAFDVAESGVQGSGAPGTLATSVTSVDRPRVVRGPFPFPKERRAFTLASATTQALTGVEASGNEGDLPAVDVTIGLTGLQATGLQGTIVPQTPGSAVLVGVVGTSGAGTLTPVNAEALAGQQATAALGTLTPIRSTIDRPIYVTGPFPFLTSGMFQFRQRARLVNPVQGSVTVGLTGIAATSAVNSLSTLTHDNALTGQAATGATGTITPALTLATTGVPASGSLGTFGIGQSLSGVQATPAVGSVTPSISVALTGESASGVLGALGVQSANDGSAQLVGLIATTAPGTLAAENTEAITGEAATSATGTAGVDRSVSLVGLEAGAFAGSPSPAGDSIVALSGVSASASIGDVAAVPGPVVQGLSADGEAGTFTLDTVVALTGTEATGHVDTLRLVEVAPTPNRTFVVEAADRIFIVRKT